jgi:hypothetical protein
MQVPTAREALTKWSEASMTGKDVQSLSDSSGALSPKWPNLANKLFSEVLSKIKVFKLPTLPSMTCIYPEKTAISHLQTLMIGQL